MRTFSQAANSNWGCAYDDNTITLNNDSDIAVDFSNSLIIH